VRGKQAKLCQETQAAGLSAESLGRTRLLLTQLSARLPSMDGCCLPDPTALPRHRGAHGGEHAISSPSLLSNNAVSSPDLQGEQLPVHSRLSSQSFVLHFFLLYKSAYLDSTCIQEEIWLI